MVDWHEDLVMSKSRNEIALQNHPQLKSLIRVQQSDPGVVSVFKTIQ